MEHDEHGVHNKILTYQELATEVDKELDEMSEKEKHIRTVQNDPTFLQTVLTSMKPHQKVELNQMTHQYTYMDKTNMDIALEWWNNVNHKDRENYIISYIPRAIYEQDITDGHVIHPDQLSNKHVLYIWQLKMYPSWYIIREQKYKNRSLRLYFPHDNDVDEWIMLNALRILKNDEHKTYSQAINVSISQLVMDINTDWYNEIRFTLDDLRNKSTKELDNQQKKFVIKNITPHFTVVNKDKIE